MSMHTEPHAHPRTRTYLAAVAALMLVTATDQTSIWFAFVVLTLALVFDRLGGHQ